MSNTTSIHDLEYAKFDDNGNVKVALGTASVVVDAEIGAVEIKNGTTDTRLHIVTDEDAMPATPNILPVGMEYRATATTYTDGDAAVLQGDVNANLKTTLATGLAGEDLTNDVLKTEQRFSYYHHVGTAGSVSGTVKSGAGFLHSVVIGNHTAGGTYTLYDSIGTSASVISIISSAGAVSPLYVYNVSFATGLTIVSGSVADVTINYR